MSDVVLKVENLYKEYRLGVISHGTLFRDLQSWWARVRGQEDPNSLVSAIKPDTSTPLSVREELKQHFLALNDVSFEVKQGDILGVIGKNGAGKSTLLKVLSRITAPTAGSVKIKGRIASLLEVGTGFHPELTGRENIYMNGAILGMRRWEITQKMDEIVAFAGLEKFIDTPVKRYSSGMYVRLAFAVAAHLDAEILLMDEVLAVGDAEFQKKALGKMGDVAKSGRTVLFVSHNMGAMKSLCGCGVVLEYGRIKAASDNIDRLAMNYLNNFGQNRPYTKWVNNGALQDPNFNPISLELQEEDGSAINSGISADKNYIVKLVFEIKEIDYLMNFWLSVFDMGDNCLFSIFPQGDKNYKPKAGLSTIYFTLPKGILGVQEYLINLASSIHNVRWIVDPQTHLVSITVPVTHKEILPMVGQGLISPYIKVFLE